MKREAERESSTKEGQESPKKPRITIEEYLACVKEAAGERDNAMNGPNATRPGLDSIALGFSHGI